MKHILPQSIEVLSEKLARLPGIGQRSAGRIVFALIKRPDVFLQELGQAVLGLKKQLRTCSRCFLITDQPDLCIVCQDPKRDAELLCVVEGPLDVVALEQSSSFGGVYHVLGGAISPLDGIGPAELHIQELVGRIVKEKIKEVIIATNPSLEGEATALYISDKIKKSAVKVTRIARGLPSGGSLEYADEVTLSRALEDRQEVRAKEE